jgi:ppGpp synthetase/RelA/SpoT-type nucleotidyltranferase
VIDDSYRIARLLTEYDQRESLYREYVDHLIAVTGTMLYDAKIKCHAITGRLKARESFHGKVKSGKKQYAEIDEVTDVAGLRITTYFARDVDRVAEVIAPRFVVDEKNSVDRRKTIESDRFGYLSLHYIVRPKDGDDPLARAGYTAVPAEIQVRSILQHAWAEIEHDLGYKYPGGIPRHIRRKFSLAAGLLEIADQQFDDIRADIERYESELQTDLRAGVRTVMLDAHSLRAMIDSDVTISSLDRELASLVASQLSGHFPLVRLLKMLTCLQVESAVDLKNKLDVSARRIKAFAGEWFSDSGAGGVVALNHGISIVFLFYDEISIGLDASRVIASLTEVGVSEKSVAEMTGRVLSVAKALDANNGETVF